MLHSGWTSYHLNIECCQKSLPLMKCCQLLSKLQSNQAAKNSFQQRAQPPRYHGASTKCFFPFLSLCILLAQWFHPCFPLASCEVFLTNAQVHTRPIKSQSMGRGPRFQQFSSFSQVFLMHKVEVPKLTWHAAIPTSERNVLNGPLEIQLL